MILISKGYNILKSKYIGVFMETNSVYKQNTDSPCLLWMQKSEGCANAQRVVGASVAIIATIVLLGSILLVVAQQGYNLYGITAIAHAIAPKWVYTALALSAITLIVDVLVIIRMTCPRHHSRKLPDRNPLQNDESSDSRHDIRQGLVENKENIENSNNSLPPSTNQTSLSKIRTTNQTILSKTRILYSDTLNVLKPKSTRFVANKYEKDEVDEYSVDESSEDENNNIPNNHLEETTPENSWAHAYDKFKSFEESVEPIGRGDERYIEHLDKGESE